MKSNELTQLSPNQIISENIILSINQLTKVLNVSRTTLEKYRKQEGFPKPVGGQSNRPKWITEEIVKWIKTSRV
ncbi:hypothetical protein [uncultured Succinivibrio sp.]|uniref:helix-turn-helix transcriptional regulator n=1 Tax=uncultured Succinivibrio sp. TaxID=540749 RepID=UPI0025DB0B77|nr:hypothetical protein [uncultured Succinivibrio sp.]